VYAAALHCCYVDENAQAQKQHEKKKKKKKKKMNERFISTSQTTTGNDQSCRFDESADDSMAPTFLVFIGATGAFRFAQ
jgi:hypothetical protein